jgi:hypothetical protein
VDHRDRQPRRAAPYREAWVGDLILQHAQGTRLVADTGFHIPSGILQAPGTVLTIELQEDSTAAGRARPVG